MHKHGAQGLGLRVRKVMNVPRDAGKGSHVRLCQKQPYPFGGLHNKDYSVWGSLLGSPYFGKAPCGEWRPGSPVVVPVESLTI